MEVPFRHVLGSGLRGGPSPLAPPVTWEAISSKREIMPGQTERITGKNFDAPDEQRRPFERGKIYVITVGG